MLLQFLQRPSEWRIHDSNDEARLVVQGRRHGLSGVVSHQLKVQGMALSPLHQLQLAQDARAIMAGTLRVKQLLLRALEVMNAVKVIPIVLKGYGLATRFYPEPLQRSMSDVDLLVSTQDLSRSMMALSSLKMNRAGAEAERYVEEHRHDIKFWNSSGMIELHCRLFVGMGCNISSDDAFPFSHPDLLEGRSVRYLNPECELTYLSLHGTAHLFQRLAWLYDIKCFLEFNRELNWSQVQALSHSWGADVAVYTALDLARRWLNAPIPLQVLRHLRPRGWQRAFEKYYFSEKRLLEAPSGDHGRWGLALNLLLIDGFKRKIHFGSHHTWHGIRRKLARHFPKVTPLHWKG